MFFGGAQPGSCIDLLKGEAHLIDIAAFVVVTACVFGVMTAKVAYRKQRSWPFWCILGIFSMPIALIAVLLMPPLRQCPSCGKFIVIKPGRKCRQCGWKSPPPMRASAVASSIKGALGFKLGDKETKIGRILDRRGATYKRTPDDRITFSEESLFGHAADVTIELDGGRANLVSVAYPIDRDYAIYYELKASLVAEYGRPAYENFDDGYSDNWSAKGLLVSLATNGPKDSPTTSIVYQKLSGKLRKDMNDVLS